MVSELKAFPALFHDERADTLRSDAGSRHGKYDVCIGFTAVGDEDLFSIEEVVVTLENSGSLRSSCVGSCVGFRQTEGTDLFTLGQGNQVLLLLFFRTEGEDRPGTQRNVSR